jgi:Zn-finger nucleic acid-binding protein
LDLTLTRNYRILLDEDDYQEKMICVNCRKPMVVLELAGVEVDYCSFCEGIWLDAGEIELLAAVSGNPEESSLPDFSGWSAGRSTKKCPICLRRMQQIISPEGERVALDRCKRGHGIWFDRGELGMILRNFQGSNRTRVAELLREIFPESPK